MLYLPGDEPTSGLHEEIEAALANTGMFPRSSSGMFRPSEASAQIQTKYGPLVIGHCARSTWFRLKGAEQTDAGFVPHQQMRMDVGREVEDAFIEKCKARGIWAGNNLAFQTTLDGVSIAGELDAVLKRRQDGVRYIVECKSIYSYYAQKEIFGKFLKLGDEPGKPKDSYVMQLSLYLRHFGSLPKDHPQYIPFGSIFVCDRGDGHFGTFDTWLEDELKVIGEDERMILHKIKYFSPKMGVPVTTLPYTVEDILSRYRMVKDLLSGEKPPARDFIKEYDKETVEIRYAQGMISKSAYEKWSSSHGPRGKGKEKLGDFFCNGYCPYEKLCWEVFEK